MFYTVYKITNLINNKIYIGAHKTNNLNDGYMGSGKIIQKSVIKYGIENFKKEYLYVYDNSEDMYRMESKIVNNDFIKRDDTYNIKCGGHGGFDYINTQGLNCSHNNRINSLNNLKLGPHAFSIKLYSNYNFREQWRSNISAAMILWFDNNDGNFKGKKHTDETKKKIGEKNSIHQSGEGNSQFGTIWVYNLELKENKKIKKDEFGTWFKNGWIKGRKMSF